MNPANVEYGSGDFVASMQQAPDAADYPAWRAARAEARKAGRYCGIGIANYVEPTAAGRGREAACARSPLTA
jgi:aerobic carbon-monoxide dehydrogenase large subunit